MKRRKYRILALSVALAVSAASISGCGSEGAQAQTPVFTLSSTDLASGTFDTKFILNGFGCTGGNISPALQWSNVPAGTKSLSLQVYDPDAPTGSGFWHWAVYNIPPTATGLARSPVLRRSTSWQPDRRGATAGRRQQPGNAARGRVRRQHRLPRHRSHGRQWQLWRSMPAGGRQTASLYLHAVCSRGSRCAGGGRGAENRQRWTVRFRAGQSRYWQQAAWHSDIHRHLRQISCLDEPIADVKLVREFCRANYC